MYSKENDCPIQVRTNGRSVIVTLVRSNNNNEH